MAKRPTTRSVLALITALALGACQQAALPDRHVLWTGTGVPMAGASVVSTHDSKAACATARGQLGLAVRQPGDIVDGPLKDGSVMVVGGGVFRTYVCYPVGVNPG